MAVVIPPVHLAGVGTGRLTIAARARAHAAGRDPAVAPQASVKNCFIRGSVIRYVQVPKSVVDTDLLQDAARKEATTQLARAV